MLHAPKGSVRLPKEEEALDTICSRLRGEVKVINLGYLSRYIFHQHDDGCHFYMLGSMGLTSSIAMGLSLALKGKRKIYVIDGDGSVLMNLGALSFIRQVSGIRLLLIDNGCHNSTGGQPTSSNAVDFCQVARGCGFTTCYDISDIPQLETALDEIEERDQQNNFLRIKVQPMVNKPKRVTLSPQTIAERFRHGIHCVREEIK